MQDKGVVIIGGGLGGLTAGATLAKWGHRVLLVERHYVPGGCATTFKRKDFLMEVGLHEMDGLDAEDPKTPIFDFLEIGKNLDLVQVPELFRAINGQQDFVQPHGEHAAMEALCQSFPEEIKAIKAFFQLIFGVRREITKIPSHPWLAKLMLPLFPVLFPNTVKASRTALGDYLDGHFQDEDLKLKLIANLQYYHDDPYTMSMIYFAVAQASYVKGGGHFVKGGSQQLSDYLAEIIRSNGGTVLLGKEVTHIEVQDDTVAGVTFRDRFNPNLPVETVQSGHVIANAAVPLVADMLPPRQKEKILLRSAGFKPSCSLFSIYVGFNRDLAELGSAHYSTFFGPVGVTSLKGYSDTLKADFDARGFVFVDYGRIQSGLTPQGKSFGCLCGVDYLEDWENLDEQSYRRKKEEAAQVLFDRLDAFLPGAKSAIEHYEFATPRTVMSYTANPSGATYGFAQLPQHSGVKRLPIKSGIKGLQFASAWSFPGGGFSGAIISGFLSAQELGKASLTPNTPRAGRHPDSRSVPLITRRQVAKETFELVFEKPEGFYPAPGQYAFLSLDKPQDMQIDIPVRTLSIVSSPDEDVVRFAMRESGSSFKQSCLAMQPQDTATIYGPTGDFVLPEKPRPTAFLVGGIGITPVVPMIKALQANGFEQETHLFYSSKNRDSMAYLEAFEAIKDQPFSLHLINTASEQRLSEALLASKLGRLCDYHFFVVGTGGFLNAMMDILGRADVPSDQIIADDFG